MPSASSYIIDFVFIYKKTLGIPKFTVQCAHQTIEGIQYYAITLFSVGLVNDRYHDFKSLFMRTYFNTLQKSATEDLSFKPLMHTTSNLLCKV